LAIPIYSLYGDDKNIRFFSRFSSGGIILSIEMDTSIFVTCWIAFLLSLGHLLAQPNWSAQPNWLAHPNPLAEPNRLASKLDLRPENGINQGVLGGCTNPFRC